MKEKVFDWKKVLVVLAIVVFIAVQVSSCRSKNDPTTSGTESGTIDEKETSEDTEHVQESSTESSAEESSEGLTEEPTEDSSESESSGEELVETEPSTTEEPGTDVDQNESSSVTSTGDIADEESTDDSSSLNPTTGATKPSTETPSTEEPTTEAPKPVLSSVNVKAKTAAYEYGYKLTSTDLTVTAKYSDGSSKTIASGYAIKQNGVSVYVIYSGVTSNTITISYNAPKVTSVTVSANSSQYPEGYKLTASDLTVKTAYQDNSTKTITSGYEIVQSGTSLYVNYSGVKSNTITITFVKTGTDETEPVLESVSVSTNATQYKYGYKLTKSDLTVKAVYSNTTKTVVDYTVTQSGASLYVTYNGMKSNTITVNYAAPAVTTVSISAKASQYKYGYQLTTSDLTVKATYEDNSTKTITSGYEIVQSGTSVYVNYSGVKSNTITVNYAAPAVTSVSISAKANQYKYGYQLTTSDLTVKAIYEDSSSKTITSGYKIVQSGTSVYVNYGGVKSNTITVNYAAPAVASVSISANAMYYPYAYEVFPQDLTVIVTYEDSSTKTITEGFVISQDGASVYVTYEGVKSNTITITFSEPGVTSVVISAKATEYEAGYQLTHEDLNVTATFEDNSSKSIVGSGLYVIYQTDDSLYVNYKGMQSNTITINYKASSATATVTSVTIALKRNSYMMNDTITVDDFTVTAHYSDNSSKVVTDGLTLMDKSLEGSSVATSITLNEYIGSHYMKSGYFASIVYDNVESNRINIPWKYEEGIWLCPDMLTLVNNARREAGLSELHWDSAAESAATTRALELVTKYSHERPDGSKADSLYALVMGENISYGAYRATTDMQSTFDAWMNSAGHRACIMDDLELTTGFVAAYCVATNTDGAQYGYWVMLTTMN